MKINSETELTQKHDVKMLLLSLAFHQYANRNCHSTHQHGISLFSVVLESKIKNVSLTRLPKDACSIMLSVCQSFPNKKTV